MHDRHGVGQGVPQCRGRRRPLGVLPPRGPLPLFVLLPVSIVCCCCCCPPAAVSRSIECEVEEAERGLLRCCPRCCCMQARRAAWWEAGGHVVAVGRQNEEQEQGGQKPGRRRRRQRHLPGCVDCWNCGWMGFAVLVNGRKQKNAIVSSADGSDRARPFIPQRQAAMHALRGLDRNPSQLTSDHHCIHQPQTAAAAATGAAGARAVQSTGQGQCVRQRR